MSEGIAGEPHVSEGRVIGCLSENVMGLSCDCTL